MSGKIKKTKKKVSTRRKTKVKSKIPSFYSRKNWISLAVVLIVTIAAFSPIVNNEFTNWDDNLYVTENPLIRSLDAYTLKQMFTTPSAFNYHPLTILSLNLNYQVSELNPRSYYLVNLLFHLINCGLLFYLFWMVTRGNYLISLGVATLFAIHPMHVESVAWISERKDVLYAFFFFLALISYTRYLKSKSNKTLILVALFFLLSLLSKPAAVILPVVLLLFDYFSGRRFSRRAIIEKIPFFGLSIVFGIITMRLQRDFVNNIEGESINFIQKLFATSYGLMVYLIKFVIPVKLSSFHPYPDLDSIPILWLVSPLLLLLILYGWYKLKSHRRVLEFGLGFFLLNLALVVPIVAIGEAVVSERYTYLPYIGLSFIIAFLFDRYHSKDTASFIFKKGLPVLGLIFIFGFSFLTFQRSKVWKNSKTLWTNVIGQYPNTSKAYTGRGAYYMGENNFDLAEKDYRRAIELAPSGYLAYYNLGLLLQKRDQIGQAIEQYNLAISKNPSKFGPYNNLGGLLIQQGRFDEAIETYNNAIRAEPGNPSGWFNRAAANYKKQDYNSAVADYKRGLAIQPNAPDKYFFLGLCYERLNRFAEASQSMQTAINYTPGIAKYYFYNARILDKMGNKSRAYQNAIKAKELGYDVDQGFLNRLR